MKSRLKILIVFVATILLGSCKAKLPTYEVSKQNVSNLPTQDLLTTHYKKTEFQTISIKADARYEDPKDIQNVSADIRIQKDDKILISVRVLGITMAKALVTPNDVKYYDKLNQEYFEGNYDALSKWLGADLDYQKLQNMLLGIAIEDLRLITHEMQEEPNDIKIKMQKAGMLAVFFFSRDRFLLNKQEIAQPERGRKLTASYTDYTQFPQMLVPSNLLLEANQDKGKVKIDITYKQVSFNEALSFPYSVPDGYDRILID